MLVIITKLEFFFFIEMQARREIAVMYLHGFVNTA